jgi:hypothetical protein
MSPAHRSLRPQPLDEASEPVRVAQGRAEARFCAGSRVKRRSGSISQDPLGVGRSDVVGVGLWDARRGYAPLGVLDQPADRRA